MSNELLVSNELTPILFTEARRRRVLLVILLAVLALAGLVAGIFWPKNFASSTSILVQESNIIKPLMEGRAVTTGNADRAAIAREVIFSRKILDEIVDIGGWKKSDPTPLELERIIDSIKARITVINLRENLIQITYKDSDRGARLYRHAAARRSVHLGKPCREGTREQRRVPLHRQPGGDLPQQAHRRGRQAQGVSRPECRRAPRQRNRFEHAHQRTAHASRERAHGTDGTALERKRARRAAFRRVRDHCRADARRPIPRATGRTADAARYACFSLTPTSTRT